MHAKIAIFTNLLVRAGCPTAREYLFWVVWKNHFCTSDIEWKYNILKNIGHFTCKNNVGFVNHEKIMCI